MPESITLRVESAQHQSEVGLGRARIDSVSRSKLGVDMGDFIEITGKRKTAAKVFRASPDDEGKGTISIDGMVRSNAGVSIGDKVVVSKANVQLATKITVAPKIPAGKRVKFGQGVEELFKKGLLSRPLVKGDSIVIPNIALMGGFLPFIILSTQPGGVVIVDNDTDIIIKTESVDVEDSNGMSITYDDIGGLEGELKRVREIIELPLKHPELFDRLGIDPPKGVLLYGPPGTGKTLIAKAVANECKVNFISVKGPEIMSKWMGDSEKAVRQIFKKAKQIAPSIIFLDEIDAIAPKRGHSSDSGTTERVVNQLLTSMDGFEDMERVMVVGATNRPDIIDPALLRPGRFDSLTLVPLPDVKDREAILRLNTKNMHLDNVDFKILAAKTEWFSGADITALCRESGLNAIRNGRSVVSQPDFEKALKNIYPSCDKNMMKWYEEFSKKIEKVSPDWKDAGAYR